MAHAKSLFVADQMSAPDDVDPDDESTQNVEMPDIYSDLKATSPHLKVTEAVAADSDDTRGFNPYDTGTLQKKDSNEL
ncbi:MAG: hypothetical protein IID57_12925 [Proteobacteria bacterium]|nr:hypothetical protein [Pseudomonadota bacterium]